MSQPTITRDKVDALANALRAKLSEEEFELLSVALSDYYWDAVLSRAVFALQQPQTRTVDPTP
jgi:hypothetical protein